MSERPLKLLLDDIFDAADAVLSFISEVDYDQFVSDRMRRDAVIRNIEVMGEAVNKLPQAFINAHTDVEWHKAIAMRNRLIHGYFSIDYKIVWNTVMTVLPDFRQQIQRLLLP